MNSKIHQRIRKMIMRGLDLETNRLMAFISCVFDIVIVKRNLFYHIIIIIIMIFIII